LTASTVFGVIICMISNIDYATFLTESQDKKVRDCIELECPVCNNAFQKKIKEIMISFQRNKSPKFYCSRVCSSSGFSTTDKKQICTNCNKPFLAYRCETKYKNVFCSKSCAATYNNTHKTHGYRRSKLEIWLESELLKLYPKLEIHYCRKDAINSELDIYIPSLKLAFELNGIFHYEPIYGEEQFKKIQNNDNRKFQACLEKQIELCIINASTLNHFNPKRGLKYLDIITNIVNKKLEAGVAFETTTSTL